MSGTSPARKFRSRTSEFLRGSSNQARQVQGAQGADHADDHERGRVVELDHDPSPKKRGSRIPFIGRGRKKSLQSDQSEVEGQEVQEGRASAATTRSRSLLDEQAGVLTAQPRASTSNPSLPTAQPTFGAKFAAHFSSGKSKGILSYSKSVKKRSKKSGTETDYASDSLAAGRSTSIDSKTSRRSRSATPRPSQSQPVARPPPVQPTITVTDTQGLDEFEGLFTKPRHKPKPLVNAPENPASPYHSDDAYLSSPTINSYPALPRLAGSDSHADPSSSNHPTSSSKRSSIASVASVSLSVRSGRQSAAREDALGMEKDLDSAEESEAISMLSMKSLPVASLRSRKSSSSSATVTSISIDKRRSSAVSRRNPAVSLGSSPPPSIPLPSPPLNTPPLVPPTPPPQVPLPNLPTDPGGSMYRRPRAHTISSSLSGSPAIPNSPPDSPPALPEESNKSSLRRHKTTTSPSSILVKSRSPTPPEASPDDTIVNRGSGSSSSSSSTPTLTKAPSPDLPHTPPPSPKFSPSPIADSDIGTATISQLRDALRLRNEQFDELVSFMQKRSEHHQLERKWLESKIASAETDKKVLEGRIISLERDASRRDKEIKGLTWLVTNSRSLADPAAAIRQIGLSARSAVGIEGTLSTSMSLSKSSSTSTMSTSGTGTPELATSDESSTRSLATVPTPSSSSVKLPIYRKMYIGTTHHDDSGVESSPAYLTSTSMDGEGEVVSAPETSRPSQYSFSTVSSLKPRRTMRKLKLVESVNSRAFGSSVGKGPTSSAPPLPISIPDDVPYLLKPNKRASSSASSASTPSPPMSPKSPDPILTNFPTSTGQQTPTLSAIPESPPSSSPGLSVSGDSKSKDRERKPSTSRISFSFSHSKHSSSSGRSSTSSGSIPSTSSPSGPPVPPKPKTPTKSSAKASSSTPTSQRLTPSEAYALNLKKGRPPSIAQVLNKGSETNSGPAQTTGSSPSIGLMEESFGGRSRALLGLAATSSTIKDVRTGVAEQS